MQPDQGQGHNKVVVERSATVRIIKAKKNKNLQTVRLEIRMACKKGFNNLGKDGLIEWDGEAITGAFLLKI